MSSDVTQMKAVLDVGPSNGNSRGKKSLEEKKGAKRRLSQKKINEEEAEDGDEAQGADTP